LFAKELADVELPKRENVILQQFAPDGGDDLRGFLKKKRKKTNPKFEKRMNHFEHSLVAKIFLHAIPVRRRLAFTFGLSEQHMGGIIETWVPLWQSKTPGSSGAATCAGAAEQRQQSTTSRPVANNNNNDGDDDIEDEGLPA
jgi:hypothetical protein